MTALTAHSGGPAIAVAHLVKRFDDVLAVNDISFTVARGSIQLPATSGVKASATAVEKQPGWATWRGSFLRACSGTAHRKSASRSGAPCGLP